LQVVPDNNATTLAKILEGQAVVVSNAKLNCFLGASGTFDGTNSNLGITSGILLTTGQVTGAVGPNTDSKSGVNNNVTYQDPNLVAIEASATQDACILEFDAIPSCSTLAFTFSFGSEEYNEYVNPPPPANVKNDCFGIFVSGPNPTGPAYSGYNMALLPSTTIPVSILNVNNGYNSNCPANGPCVNCQYFFDNCNGASVQYDGFTNPITVTLNVKPCASYHFKLAIADAVDGAYDSGVFFGLKSLACNPMPILVATTSTPSTCTAQNGSATATATGGTTPYTYAWSTTPVQTTQIATGLAPGNYSVTILDGTGCFSNTGTVTVGGTGGFSTTEMHTDVKCFGNNNGSATITPSGGNGPYTYSWSTTPVQTSSSISNFSAGNYTCIITDATGCLQTQTLTISQPSPFVGAITNTVNVSCPSGKNGSATATASGGVSPYNYLWNTSPIQAGAVASNLTGGNHIVNITDANGCTATQTVIISEPAPMNLPINTTIATCGMADGSATVNPSGGVAPYTYLWLTAPVVQTSPIASNLSIGTYTVLVTDSNGCLQQKGVAVPGGAPPIANFYFTPSVVSLLNPMVTFQDASIGVNSSYKWNFGDINFGSKDTSSLPDPTHTYSDTGRYCIQLKISNPTGLCADSIIKCIKVEPLSTFYIPNTFTPNDDTQNDYFRGYGTFIKEFHMDIFDRWGNHLFESNDINKGWNGTVDGNTKYAPEDIYVWKVKVVAINKEEYNYIGLLNLIR
jgi:gliding motility-associated-like protein